MAAPAAGTCICKRTVYAAAGGQKLWRCSEATLSGCKVAGAPFGGPVAIVQPEDESGPATVRVFTCAGALVSQWSWHSPGGGAKLHSIAWTQDEDLLSIATDGTAVAHDMHGDEKRRFNIMEKADLQGHEVRMARFYPSGVLLFVSKPCSAENEVEDAQILYYPLRGADEGDPSASEIVLHEDVQVDGTGLAYEPLAIDCIPAEMTSEDAVELFVAPREEDVEDGTLWEGKGHEGDRELRDMQTPQLGHVERLAVSPNARLIAAYDTDAKLHIVSADLRNFILDFHAKSDEAPHQMVWGGNDFVALSWLPGQIHTQGGENDKSVVLIVGPEGGHQAFTYTGAVHLVSECDSLRVLSDEACDLFGVVSPHAADIFAPQTSSRRKPVAVLWDAFESFDAGSAGSVKMLRDLKQADIQEAVDGCIHAAEREFDREVQQRLLKAAAHGKCFCKQNHPKEKFSEQCKHVRILNAVREPDVGIPLTVEQFTVLSPESLVDRLVLRKMYMLAFRISQYLSLSEEKVLVAWACAKVRTDAPTASIVRDIDTRFRQVSTQRGISYSEVAEKAHACGKEDLAITLLEKEPKASDQVPLLLNFKREDTALSKAIESGDVDLIYLVLWHVRQKSDKLAFMNLLNQKSQARGLFLSHVLHIGSGARFSPKEFYNKTGNRCALAFTLMRNGKYKDGESLAQAAGHFKEAGKSFEAKCVEDHKRLVDRQQDLAKLVSDRKIVGASVAKTLEMLMAKGHTSEADKVKKEFGVADKTYAWIKLRTLCDCGAWQELEKWAQKKPPFGYKPIADECRKRDKIDLAVKYVNKIDDPGQKCQVFCAMGKFDEAITVAHKEKDEGLLEEIFKQTTDKAHRARINKIMESM
eukprot:TRINITY_DN27593_c0_g1_i1.p1 TRINITY_DN27593_c0_g1~~TRINITY_DN27593_c0_g1_i1.p1  ORF type:complete len:895 (+),score=295.65 TRINITY_DN27593_c0_g1_i1:83-2686(+)